MKKFDELSEKEVLALAISGEEEDGRIYADFADRLRDTYPDTSRIFDDMAAEEEEHRRSLIDLFVQKFGNRIPLVRRQDVTGFVPRKAVWQIHRGGIEAMRKAAR